MSDDVVTFPVEKVYPNTVEAREIWDQPEPAKEVVWAVCPWLRKTDDPRCHHCPPWTVDPNYGTVQRGCYGIAAEVCRVVFAMQNREKP